MTKLSIISTLALILGVSMGLRSVQAQDSMLQGPSEKHFLECATKCQKSFYFSEQSAASFADLRNACIEGCAEVVDVNMPAYHSCNAGCQEIYPYRHGMNDEFADFQRNCIVGCRRVH